MANEGMQPDSPSAVPKGEQLKTRVLINGECYGDFRVVKCLCAGLIAHYYEMQHVRDQYAVTVGVFHHRTFGNEKFIQRLKVLQKTIATFDHEGIPKIRDVTTLDGRLCIFLDPVEEITLSHYFGTHAVAGQSGVGVQASTRIIAQLLGLIGYAHSHGLDHRDLDSDLIYVQCDGALRILGLGIKAALGVELFEAIVSASVSPLVSNKTPERLNSFDIMSPEYRSGISEDNRVDLYAVGFIGYWLLTGRKPDLVNYQPPTDFVEGISPKWNAYVELSLERVKDKRFQSCKMALVALKATDEEPKAESAGFIQRQIDRIPVPKQIIERGELATRIYRLFIIGLIGLTLTATCAYFLKVTYTEEIDYRRTVAQIAASVESASVNLNIQPPVARVEFIGFGQTFIANNGQLSLSVQPGEYKLRLSAPHHVDQTVGLHILPKASTPESRSIELRPAWADIVIQTEPGAAISVIDADGLEIELGVANEEGTFSLKKGIFAGTYQVLVEKVGYQQKKLENQVVEFGTVLELNAPLLSLPAHVTVRTQPSGASILINEVEVGTTPLSLDGLTPSGQYRVVARLEGYRPIVRTLEVKPGADMVIDFGDLVPLSGLLRVSFKVAGEGAPNPSTLYDGLKVVVDDVAIAYGDGALKFIAEGEHRIRLEHPLYVSEEVSLVVEDQGEYHLDFTLSLRPAQVRIEIPGQLEAELRLDGRVATLEDGKIKVPANQEVEFELRVRDHLTMVRTFKLAPNESYVWEVQPLRIPGPTEGQIWTLPYYGIAFAWVPPGSFEMGSSLPEHARLPNEGPQTRVRFTYGFWAGIYEVTQAQYAAVIGQNPSEFKHMGRPVESVLWSEAQEFCDMLSSIERDAGRLPVGYVYRLPTEAEWEYAARGGTTTPFTFGEEADASMGHFRGVYPRDREGGLRSPVGGYGTATVGRYTPNAFGLYDVHGNVREWTLDAYNGRLPGDPLLDPRPRTEGARIAVRGGGWADYAPQVRSSTREQVSPDVQSNDIGFRVVLAPEF